MQYFSWFCWAINRVSKINCFYCLYFHLLIKLRYNSKSRIILYSFSITFIQTYSLEYHYHFQFAKKIIHRLRFLSRFITQQFKGSDFTIVRAGIECNWKNNNIYSLYIVDGCYRTDLNDEQIFLNFIFLLLERNQHKISFYPLLNQPCSSNNFHLIFLLLPIHINNLFCDVNNEDYS